LADLDAMLQVLIRTRRAADESRDDLLSVLLAAVDEDSGARMSDQQLRDEIMTLFLAGHETTANALTWTFYLLSRHPEVETRLVDELQRVLASRVPSMNDLPELPYTEMVIREALRLYPPAPGLAREPIEDVTIGGYNVPKVASSAPTPTLFNATVVSLRIRSGTIRTGSLQDGRSASLVMRIYRLARVRACASGAASR
jgi:cytochrome P450